MLLDGILSPGLGRDGQFPGTFPSEVHLTLVRSVLQTVFQFFCWIRAVNMSFGQFQQCQITIDPRVILVLVIASVSSITLLVYNNSELCTLYSKHSKKCFICKLHCPMSIIHKCMAIFQGFCVFSLFRSSFSSCGQNREMSRILISRTSRFEIQCALHN